jgi:hypothetical protein
MYANSFIMNYAICSKMDGTGDHHVIHSKPDSERQKLHVFSPIKDLDLKERKKNAMNVKGRLFGELAGGRR